MKNKKFSDTSLNQTNLHIPDEAMYAKCKTLLKEVTRKIHLEIGGSPHLKMHLLIACTANYTLQLDAPFVIKGFARCNCRTMAQVFLLDSHHSFNQSHPADASEACFCFNK